MNGQGQTPEQISPGASGSPLRSVHTESFPALLRELGVSLLVTTYQAGKLVVLRADDGVLNTHFRSFHVPMGLAVEGDRLAIGTALEIWEYHNVPAVAAKLEPGGKHDACFLPRGSITTGNIQIHEMAWGTPGQADAWQPEAPARKTSNPSLALRAACVDAPGAPELWFVNTRFSCLCTRAPSYSFVPRWQPPFISALAPEDRCHLNGLALDQGQPRFATALAASDEPAGWRPYKRDGGVLLDVPSGEVVTRGLSMPHSPRCYRGQVWLLNSGAGGLGLVQPGAGTYEEVAALPGFTRGLDFGDRFAFIGLSQVRESAIFSGITIAERPLAERCCGVWVVDLATGQTVAFVKFEEGVQEIFAVQVLPGRRFPELLNDDLTRIADSFVLPDGPLAGRSRLSVPAASTAQ